MQETLDSLMVIRLPRPDGDADWLGRDRRHSRHTKAMDSEVRAFYAEGFREYARGSCSRTLVGIADDL
jgi:hypothetical protein